jgi:septin family protein
MMDSITCCFTDPVLVLLLQVEKTQVLIKENGVQLRLTVVDTPGFGDAVDNSTR